MLPNRPTSVQGRNIFIPAFAAMIAIFNANGVARADNFVAVRYDPPTDELVVTMRYRGSNANHAFTLQWGECKRLDSNPNLQQVSAVVLDDQWKDAAHELYTTTVRFGLADMPCRPAQVTLRSAPRYEYTISIPGAPSSR